MDNIAVGVWKGLFPLHNVRGRCLSKEHCARQIWAVFENKSYSFKQVLKLLKNNNLSNLYFPFQVQSQSPSHNPMVELGGAAEGCHDGNLA
jgi:hypothetical protein